MAGALTGMVGGSKAGGSQQARAQLQAYEDIIKCAHQSAPTLVTACREIRHVSPGSPDELGHLLSIDKRKHLPFRQPSSRPISELQSQSVGKTTDDTLFILCISAMTSEERSDPSKFGPAERMRVAAAVKCNKAQVMLPHDVDFVFGPRQARISGRIGRSEAECI